MYQLTHQTIRGVKEIDVKMETRDGDSITLREYFAELLINVPGKPLTNMIKRTERGPDNKVYLIHLKEHSDTVTKLINDMSNKLDKKFAPEELLLSQGPDLVTRRNLTTFATPATRKNAEFLRNLHGMNQPLVNRLPPRHSRRPITASYPQDFPTLPTGKSNSWDDRRARQKSKLGKTKRNSK